MTEQQIVRLKERLKEVTKSMRSVAIDMAFCSDLTSELTLHGKELLGMSEIAEEWLTEDWNVGSK
jgi:hypothetical protein